MTELIDHLHETIVDATDATDLTPVLLCTKLLRGADRAYTIQNRIYFGREFAKRLKNEIDKRHIVKPGQYRDAFNGLPIEDADDIGFSKKGRAFTDDERQIQIELMALLPEVYGDDWPLVWQQFVERSPHMETDTAKIYGGIMGETERRSEESTKIQGGD